MNTENQEVSENTPEAVDAPETVGTPEIEVSPEEARARKNGWVGLDEWVEQGRKPEDHVPAKFFNQKGDMIGQINKLKDEHRKTQREIEERLRQNNEFHKANLDVQLKNLEEKLKTAVEDGDYNQVQNINQQKNTLEGQINQLNQASIPQVNEDIIHEQEWAQSNPWFTETSPKGAYAQQVANKLLAQGVSGKALTDQIEKEISVHFPDPKTIERNENREKAPVTDRAAPKTGKEKEVFTFDSLSAQEKSVYMSLKNSGRFDDKALEKMIKDARK